MREEELAERQPPKEETSREHLNRIFQYKEGKGNFTEERHQEPMPDIDTIGKRVLKMQAENFNSPPPGDAAANSLAFSSTIR